MIYYGRKVEKATALKKQTTSGAVPSIPTSLNPGLSLDLASQMRSRRIGRGNPGFGRPEISDIVDPLPAVGTSHLKSRYHTFEN
jgi:hypothetical protein